MTPLSRSTLGPAFAAALVLALLASCDRQSVPLSSAAAATPASAPAAASQPASAAQAQPLVPDQVAVAAAADPQLVATGKQLATQGSGAAAACASCHGANGEGNAQTGFPRLAGQGKLYLVHQLDSYAKGSRKNAVMQPIATALNDSQRQAAAAYYASLSNPAGAGGARTAPRGAGGREPRLANMGDNARQLQSCANCHGPQGIGDAAVTPYLAGQHASYLTAAMAEWKNGTRDNDPSGQMPQIARALTDADVKALVTYYAALPPPAPRNAQAAPPALPARRASVQSGPAGATGAAQGTGTEQGAPLTGGAQSQGAGGAATNQPRAPGTGNR